MGRTPKGKQADFLEMKKIITGKGEFEFKIKDGENLDLYLIQEESCDTKVKIIQGKNSRSRIFTINLKGTIKNELTVELRGKGAEASLFGLSIGMKNEIIENHTFVRHAVGNTASNQSYKSILGGRAMAVFDGKIRVEKGADKSFAYQLNKNILLSDEATMNSKPVLEIFADDVKCTHGATTGQIDREAIFYLKSRGIEEAEAKKILIEAFVKDLISGISDADLRKTTAKKVSKKLQI